LPLRYNDGGPVEAGKFQEVQKRLLKQFGGVTFFPQPNEGQRQLGDVVYKDEIVVYRALSAIPRKARAFFRGLKETLKQEFRMEDILIVERDVESP